MLDDLLVGWFIVKHADTPVSGSNIICLLAFFFGFLTWLALVCAT